MTASELLANLKTHANPANVAGMARYGINSKDTLGVSIPVIRGLAKQAGRSHELAEELWQSGIHEARILATLVDDHASVTRSQMNRWARDLDSWDVCDQLCSNLFRYTPFAFDKAAGQTKGQAFEKQWYVVNTNGALVKHAVATPPTTTTATTTSGGPAWG